MTGIDNRSWIVVVLAAVLGLAVVGGCVSYADEDYAGEGDLTPGTLSLKGFNLSTGGVDPPEDCNPPCTTGYVCQYGACVPAEVGPYCNAVIYCVCPMVATEYPTCAAEAATMGETTCQSLISSSFPSCMP